MSNTEKDRTESERNVSHVDQSPPFEWSAWDGGDRTYIAWDKPERAGAEMFVVSAKTRNVRDLARADAVLYEGNLVFTRFDEDLRCVEFNHDYAGHMGRHHTEEWLDEPAVRLAKLPHVTGEELIGDA